MYKFFKLFPALFISAGIAILGYYYWRENHYLTTQNAHVTAHLIAITSPVSGKIAVVYTQNRAFVKKGQPLFQMDQTRYRAAIAAAQEKLYQIQFQVKTAEEKIALAEKAVNKQQSALSALSKQAFAFHNNPTGTSDVTVESANDIHTQVAMAAEGLELAEQQLEQAYQAFALAFPGPGDAETKVKLAKAVLAEAEQRLVYTAISAPADGAVTGLTLQPGIKIMAGQTLFTLAEDNVWWVNARFTTTKLKRIQPDQPATVLFNQYPQHIFKGIVSAIYPQQENDAVIKIRILDPSSQFPLDVGATGSVTIHIGKLNKFPH